MRGATISSEAHFVRPPAPSCLSADLDEGLRPHFARGRLKLQAFPARLLFNPPEENSAYWLTTYPGQGFPAAPAMTHDG